MPSACRDVEETKRCVGGMVEGRVPSSLKVSGFLFVLSKQELIMGGVVMELDSLLSMKIMSILRSRSQLVALNLQRAQ